MTSEFGGEPALALLLGASEEVPRSVRRCAKRLSGLSVWHQFSRNEPAMSCQDAAQKRDRLGHRGIPLWDELKSFLGEYEDVEGTRVFLAHCRGDRELDLGKVGDSLRAMGEIRRVTPEKAQLLGTAYGTVNPVLAEAEVLQLFDDELRRTLGVPGTVMTNAGDHTWAVEFDPSEFVAAVREAAWADIVLPQAEATDRTRWGVREPGSIGILTGNPCDSGLELCHALNSHLRRLMGRNSLGDVSMPRIVLVSTPQIGISMEMDRREEPLRKALMNAIDELCSLGASVIGHPAHTTHYFAPDMADRAVERGARFVSMAEATVRHLRESGIGEIALLGTRFVTDIESPWSVYRNSLHGLTVHRPSPAGWAKIHDLGYEVQQRGPTPVSFNWMRDLLRDEVPADCKHVVLAMTEFSPVVRQLRAKGRHGKVLIDPLDIYAEAIAREYLGLTSLDVPGDASLVSEQRPAN
ncbi:MAG: aspartate/glutamate racemase family protein [Thermoanaerobaculia bacterium]